MDSEENKMKTSDTPRSDAAEYLQYDTEPPLPLGLVDVEFARKLEIELNTAIVNEAFAENKAYMLEKELKQAQDRIKRLQDWVDNLEQGHSHSGKNDNREWHGSEIGWLVPGQIVYIGEAKLMKTTYE
jgi:hypothetical protein